MDIRIKRVYDEPVPDDGLRVLCTTLWPRGLAKTGVDRWLKELGTPKELLRLWLDGKLEKAEFYTRMREALQNPEAQARLDDLAALVRSGQTVTLLTSVKPLERSHLPVVQALIVERLDK